MLRECTSGLMVNTWSAKMALRGIGLVLRVWPRSFAPRRFQISVYSFSLLRFAPRFCITRHNPVLFHTQDLATVGA